MSLEISCNEERLKQHCFFYISVFNFQPYLYYLDSVSHLQMFCYDYDFAGGAAVLNNVYTSFFWEQIKRKSNKRHFQKQPPPLHGSSSSFEMVTDSKLNLAPEQRHHLSRCMWIYFSHCSGSQCSFTALELYSRWLFLIHCSTFWAFFFFLSDSIHRFPVLH